ncbi:MAG: peptidylprolyl isomerase [Firmicutes bacterium]|nr:peptidylprolyl isomerase [Bacillota bacterium]
MDNPKIEIIVKDYGTMKAELYPETAPITVANFLKLIEEKFFDGLIFHRVIPGFMIQGGGFTEDFRQKHADSIKGEFEANGVKNDLKHTRGVLSMARTNVPDSASSQFFVMHRDAPHLDRQYAAFGKLTDGFDVLDDIAATRTGTRGFYMQDVPVKNVVIETIKLAEE